MKNVVVIETRDHPEGADKMYRLLKVIFEKHDMALSRVSVPTLFDMPTALKILVEASRSQASLAMPCGYIVTAAAISPQLDSFSLRSIQEIASYFCLPLGLAFYDLPLSKSDIDQDILMPIAEQASASCLALMGLLKEVSASRAA